MNIFSLITTEFLREGRALHTAATVTVVETVTVAATVTGSSTVTVTYSEEMELYIKVECQTKNCSKIVSCMIFRCIFT